MRINTTKSGTDAFVNDQYMSGADFKTELDMRIQGTQDALTLGYTNNALNTASSTLATDPNAAAGQNGVTTLLAAGSTGLAPLRGTPPIGGIDKKQWRVQHNNALIKYWPSISKYAAANGFDPFLIASIIFEESDFDPGNTSRNGGKHPSEDRGLMQLNSLQANEYVGLTNWWDSSPIDNQNIKYGCWELKDKMRYFSGPNQLQNAIIAYNGGQGNVSQSGGPRDPSDPHDLREYARHVNYMWNWLKANYKVLSNGPAAGSIMPLAPVTVPKM